MKTSTEIVQSLDAEFDKREAYACGDLARVVLFRSIGRLQVISDHGKGKARRQLARELLAGMLEIAKGAAV